MTLWSTAQPTNMWLEFHHSRDPDLKIMIDIMRVRTITQLETGTRLCLDNGDPYDVYEDYPQVHKMLIDAISQVQ